MLHTRNASALPAAESGESDYRPPGSPSDKGALLNGGERRHTATADDSSLDVTGAGYSEEETQLLSGQLLIQSLVPFYTATMAVLAMIIVAALVFLPSPDNWMRAGICLAALMLVGLYRWCALTQRVSAARNDLLQFVLVMFGVAATMGVHFADSAYKTEHGFIILALVMSILFHSIKACVLANIVVAAAWAYTWHASNLPFNDSILINHLAIVPFFSCAIFVSRRHNLSRLFALYRDQQQRHLETQKAVRAAREEAGRRAEAEATLQRTNREFEEFMQRVPAVCFRRTKDQMLFLSSAYERIWGRSRDKLFEDSQSFYETVHPEDRARVREDYQAYLEGKEIETEYRIVRPDGEIRWIYCTTQNIPDASLPHPCEIGVAVDVTEKKEAEEELRRQKALLELILETVPDEILLKDRQRRLLIANRAFCNNWQLDPQQVIGKTIENLLPPEVVSLSRKTDEFVLRNRESTRREFSLTDPDGSERFYEVQKLPMLEDDKIIGILGICRNLTECKEAEERFKRQEALLLHSSRLSSMGELVAGVAHEVNQPLFSILNYAKAVENTFNSHQPPDLSAIRDWVRQILREATRGGKITQRLKSFVKRADTQRASADIGDIVRESMDFIAVEARHADVSLEIDLADCRQSISVDRIQIQQVLVNLLKNAIEALAEQENPTPRVVVSTRVSTRRVPTGVEVSVADNGPGVHTEDHASILDPFQTTKSGGIGLGLAISDTIIEAHQGKLSYESNEWGGTTFRFTLPRSISQQRIA